MQRKIALASVTAALVGAGLIKLHIDRVTDEAWGGEPRELVTLTADLGPGDLLEPDHLTSTPVPDRYVESRHIPAHQRDDLLGLRLAAPVKAGELLLLTDIAGMHAGARKLSGLLADGTRAIPIQVAHSGFSRLVRPGDRVDVLLSETTDSGQVRTRTLLENVLVLAVGTDTGDTDKDSARDGGRITLNVTPDQSHSLASAESTGVLRLSLRSPSDHLLRGANHGS